MKPSNLFGRVILSSVLALGLGTAGSMVAEDSAAGQDKPGDSDAIVVATPSLLNGDVNGSGSRNLTDVVYLLNYLYLGGTGLVEATCEVADPAPPSSDASESVVYVPDRKNGDVDNSGTVNLTDAVRLMRFLFFGGAEPDPIECIEN